MPKVNPGANGLPDNHSEGQPKILQDFMGGGGGGGEGSMTRTFGCRLSAKENPCSDLGTRGPVCPVHTW